MELAFGLVRGVTIIGRQAHPSRFQVVLRKGLEQRRRLGSAMGFDHAHHDIERLFAQLPRGAQHSVGRRWRGPRKRS